MPGPLSNKILLLAAAFLALALTTAPIVGGQVRVPTRAPSPLFQSAAGKQKTELHFDPAAHKVTLKLLVQDPNGNFIPNIRRENFVVYENGTRQQIDDVEVEHAPVSVAELMEYGGRTPELNRLIGIDIARAGRQLLDAVAQDDKVGLWTYHNKVEKLSELTQHHDALESIFYSLGPPPFSETNLYDAVIGMAGQMQPVPGRKAILLISTGIDTFSKANYQDALKAAANSTAPFYVLSMVPTVRGIVSVKPHSGPLAAADWKKVESELRGIASASGGREYSSDSTLELSSIYDDMVENLKVRYVITYRSSADTDPNSPRTVRVQLVDPKTGGPLRVIDESGKPIRANVVIQDSYVPALAAKSAQAQ